MQTTEQRHSISRSEQLEAEALTVPIAPTKLKNDWIKLLDEAARTLEKLPASDLGCVYIDSGGNAVRTPQVEEAEKYHRHFGSVGGSWPRVIR